MKISYLIVAYNNFKHLERLIDQLNTQDCRIYIHVDKKSPFPQHLVNKPNVHFLQNRVKVYWGGYSLVQATINLMEYAINEGYGDYYALLSGADYPVKPGHELAKYLEQGGEYINLLTSHKSKPVSRFVYTYFAGVDRRAWYKPKTMAYYTAELFLRLVTKKKEIPFKLFVGTTWFILSKACIKHILYTLDNDARYKAFYKDTFITEESIFHTIIGNSDFLKDVKGNLTYLTWGKGPSPKMIAEEHIELLKNNNTFTGAYGTFTPFFARKFNDDSEDVINLVNQTLLNK